MKTFGLPVAGPAVGLLVGLLTVGGWVGSTGTAMAGPLNEKQIAADAQWLAHVDVENFAKSKLGEYVGRELLDRKLAGPTEKLNKSANIDFNWRKIQSITAYGWDLPGKDGPRGVLLIRSEFDIPAIIDTFVAMIAAGGEGGGGGKGRVPLQKIETDHGSIYEAQDGVFGAAADTGCFIVTRSRDDLFKALDVIKGTTPQLKGGTGLGALRGRADSYLVVGVAQKIADSFNQQLPPQAKVLKDASGARLVAGEHAEKLFVSLALDTRSAESSTQIQQLLQGLVAFANLAGEDHKELQQLAQGARVGGEAKQVTVALEMPVQDVIQQVAKVDGQSRHGKAGKPGKSAKAAKAPKESKETKEAKEPVEAKDAVEKEPKALINQ